MNTGDIMTFGDEPINEFDELVDTAKYQEIEVELLIRLAHEMTFIIKKGKIENDPGHVHKYLFRLKDSDGYWNARSMALPNETSLMKLSVCKAADIFKASEDYDACLEIIKSIREYLCTKRSALQLFILTAEKHRLS